MQKELSKVLSFKARIEKRKLSVYILKRKEGDTATWKTSETAETFNMFTGKGFTGKAVPMQLYADYLSNQLEKTVIDESGLMGKYDIKTVNAFVSKEEVLKENDRLGLAIEKVERIMDVLIIFKE